MGNKLLNTLYQYFTLGLICIVTISISIHSKANAQENLRIILHAPPPYQMNIESLWRIDFINRSSNRDVRLVGIATETKSRKWIATGITSNFIIPNGFSTISPNEISPIDYDADPEYSEIVARTGKVPSGDYTICVYVLDAITNDTIGKDCINRHTVLNVTPPQLIYPRNNAKVPERLPVFTWTQISPLTPVTEISYSIKVVEIIARQSPIDAIQSNTMWFNEDEIPIPLIQYPLSAEPLEEAVSYAWQITAYGATAGGERVELCRSEIWSFTIPTKNTDIKTDSTINERESNDDRITGKGTGITDSISVSGGGSKSKENPKDIQQATTIVNESLKAITGAEPSPMEKVCQSIKVEFIQSSPEGSYQVMINNKLDGDTVNMKPVGFILRIRGDSITQISGNISDGWNRTPPSMPPSCVEVKWKRESGLIPKGKSTLGKLSFKNSAGSPVKVNYEWINRDDKILCSDSIVLNEMITYYELSDEWSNTTIEVPNDVLYVQYVNNYASKSEGVVIIYDTQKQEQVVYNGKVNTKLISMNGINRIAIPLKEYGLMKNKNYMIAISDSKNNYILHFTIKADKVTNEREK